MSAELLQTAVRVWTTHAGKSRNPAQPRKHRKRLYPREWLVYDTETRDVAGQLLMVGVWRVYRDNARSNKAGMVCIEEGLFYPDDLPDTDPAAWSVLQSYAASTMADVAAGWPPRLQLRPVSWWLHSRLFEYGYRHANRCTVVGFNLLFDFGALAQHWGAALGFMAGGWSLAFSGRRDAEGRWQDRPGHPRLLIKSIDPRRSLIRWGFRQADTPEYGELRGQFVDLRTLCFALTDRPLRLEDACKLFGVPFIKKDVRYGEIAVELLDYARDDVNATARLFAAACAELALHRGVELPPNQLYSAATVGARYLDAWGLTPPLTKFQLSDELLGWSMASFFGGRAEARIVRTPVPVAVLDCMSMYSLQNALLDTWSLLCADRLDVVDVTRGVRDLLADAALLDRLLRPQIWREDIGVTLVELDHPHGHRLPVRGLYERKITSAHDRAAGSFGIGNNPLYYDGTVWYQLPDVVAAFLHGTGEPPQILRALRLVGQGVQDGLRPVPLRGAVPVDPRVDNPFVVMINERHRLAADGRMDKQERERLDRCLKITASATSYGVLARFDRRDRQLTEMTVYGPGSAPFVSRREHPEDPGRFTFPPVAAAITAGARLMLAMIELLVTDAEGTFAFMDTDSIAIVATADGGPVAVDTGDSPPVRALSFDEVLGIARQFAPLNIFANEAKKKTIDGSIWKAEHDSLRRPLWCYVIASKVLHPFRRHGRSVDVISSPFDQAELGDDADEMTAWSEHGLGMYCDPFPKTERRDEADRRIWTRQAAEYVLRQALGHEPDRPWWFDLPALTQFRISSPNHARWFRWNADDIPSEASPRPGGFGLLAHVIDPWKEQPAANFTDDSEEWLRADWYDRRTGKRITLTTAAPGTSAFDAAIAAGAVPVRTLGDVVDRWALRTEHKSLGPGGEPTGPTTRGLLRRRPVRSGPALTSLIGKEGHQLDERASGEVADTTARYQDPSNDEWPTLIGPILRQIGAVGVAQATGVTARRVRAWLNQGVTPHRGDTNHYRDARNLAVRYAQSALAADGQSVPNDDQAAMYAHLHRSDAS